MALLQFVTDPALYDGGVATPSATSPVATTGAPGVYGLLPLWQWLLIAALCLLALMALLPLCFACLCRLLWRSKRRQASSEGGGDFWNYEPMELEMAQVDLGDRDALVQKATRISYRSRANVMTNPLTLGELERALLNPFSITSEYASIPINMATMSEIPAGTQDKNRYNDVLPNPPTRVSLFLKFGVANSDYINANFIRGYKGSPKTYIAAQGPIPSTVEDFLRMAWEQKVSVIVMTTNLEERGRTKCSMYWPDERVNVTETFGELEVTIKRRKTTREYTVTTLHLKHTEKKVSREVTHLWFTAWPDHGVPERKEPLINFIIEARKFMKDLQTPTIVHCSAGIGRTGVFIAADIGMHQWEDTGEVDILKIVSTLRQDRGALVQTREQYIFLHEVLLEYARHFQRSVSHHRASPSHLRQPQDTPLSQDTPLLQGEQESALP